MKPFCFCLGLIITGSICYGQHKVVADKIIAIVADKIILHSDIINAISDRERQGQPKLDNSAC